MRRFTPRIIGECPKCGEPIFDGLCCFGCGFDPTDHKLKPIEMDKLK